MEEGELQPQPSEADCQPVDYSRMSSRLSSYGDDSQKLPNVDNPLKNGYSSSLSLLMSMASDVNRNLANLPSRSVFRTSSQDQDLHRNTASPNHASQLLLAAASVVNKTNNGMVSLPPAESLIPKVVSTIAMTMNNRLPATQPPYRPEDSTSVSFSAKSTMSTGINAAHMMNSHFDDRSSVRMPPIGLPPLSTITNPASHYSSEFSSVSNSSQLGVITSNKLMPHESLSSMAANILSPSTNPLPQKAILVPFLWQRHSQEDGIQYESPSGEILKSLEEVKRYLLSDETCKCGLACPFHVEKVFNFDSSYESRPWELSDIDAQSEKTSIPCCHRKHINSNALAKQCKAIPKLVKPTPPRRRVQKSTSRTSANRKPGGRSVVGAGSSKKVCDMLAERNRTDGRSSTMSSATESRVTPIPPIETVMRSPLPDASTVLSNQPDQGIMTSPRLPQELISPRVPMLSPHAVSPSGGGHMVPVIAHTGYPPTGPPAHLNGHHSQQHTPPMYGRGPHEPGLRSPPGHQAYNAMFPGLPTQGPYPAGLELMQQFRGWSTGLPGHPMPPPGTQFAAPMWQPKTEHVTPTPPKKRRRRASSKSSNGGNSDTGYTSELSSPALISPSKTKSAAHERPENSHTHRSQVLVHEELKGSPAHSSPVSKSCDTAVSSSSATSVTSTASSKSDKPSPVIPSSPLPTSIAAVPPTVAAAAAAYPTDHLFRGMPPRAPMPPYALPNGGLAYMDAMHLSRGQLPAGYPQLTSQGQLPPMYLPPGMQIGGYPPPGQIAPPPSGQVMRGVYSRPPADSPSNKPVQVPVVRKNSTGAAGDTEETSYKSSTEKSDAETVETNNKEDKTASSPRAVTKESVSLSQPAPPSPSLNGAAYHQHGMLPPALFPGVAAGMRLPGEMLPPHMNQPIHMMRTSDGQLFYRYATPRMPMPPQMYPSSYGPMVQPPLFSPTQEYGPAGALSPKRKRRKASSKTVIESHSAILAANNDQPENLSKKPDDNKTEVPKTS